MVRTQGNWLCSVCGRKIPKKYPSDHFCSDKCELEGYFSPKREVFI